MRKLYIGGKAEFNETIKEIKNKGELWLVGTDQRDGADKYFELHGIQVYKQNVYYAVNPKVYELGLPINNSLSAMVLHAYLLGYKDIEIIGAPMCDCSEYLEQKPAFAFVLGWLSGKGLKITWRDAPLNTNYGKH